MTLLSVNKIIKKCEENDTLTTVELIMCALWNSLEQINHDTEAKYLKEWCDRFTPIRIGECGGFELNFGYESNVNLFPKYCKLASKAILKIDGSSQARRVATFLIHLSQY